MKISTRNIALIAIFAALYYVLSLITPSLPVAGDVKISLEALIASVFGLVLGPYLGFLAALLGVVVAWTVPPGTMSPSGLPFFLSPPLNALVTGLVFYKKWKAGFLVFALLIVAFFFTPPVQPLSENLNVGIAVVWDKIIALLLILPCVILAKQLSAFETVPLFFLLTFIGNQVDNMWGALAFAMPPVYGGIFGYPVELVRSYFIVSPFLYPMIRFLQAIVATIIAVPLMKALKGTPWLWQETTMISP